MMRKRLYVVSMIVAILIIGVVGIFLWSDEILKVLNFQKDSEELGGFDNGADGIVGGGSLNGEVDSAGNSGGNFGSGGETSEQTCTTSQIPYSLKNFEENIICHEENGGGCIDLTVNCSVEIYNLDKGFSGEFEIRYALLDSSENELEVKTLKNNVNFGEYELFMLDFRRSDIGGVSEDLSCFFSVVDVPKKESCV